MNSMDSQMVLQSDQNMMTPQMKNSHKFIGIPLSRGAIIFWSDFILYIFFRNLPLNP